MIFILSTIILLAICLALAHALFRQTRDIKSVSDQIDRFLLYPSEPTPETLSEGSCANLHNLVSRLEQLTLIREKEAERREAGMIRFTENMVHQMKNSLTALQIQLDLLSMGAHESLPALEKCQSCMTRLTDETERILKSSQLAEGKIRMNFSPISLRALLEECCERLRPLAEVKGVSFSLSGPALTLSADPFWFSQALENVMKNAVEHTAPNTEVSVNFCERGEFAEITVADRGSGMTPDELSELFLRFHRGFTDKAGYGIGLSMTRDIIAAHHGTVCAKNRYGGGAVFELKVPML